MCDEYARQSRRPIVSPAASMLNTATADQSDTYERTSVTGLGTSSGCSTPAVKANSPETATGSDR